MQTNDAQVFVVGTEPVAERLIGNSGPYPMIFTDEEEAKYLAEAATKASRDAHQKLIFHTYRAIIQIQPVPV